VVHDLENSGFLVANAETSHGSIKKNLYSKSYLKDAFLGIEQENLFLD